MYHLIIFWFKNPFPDAIHSSTESTVDRIAKCPRPCVCVDPTAGSEQNHSLIESSSFEPNSFEVNCTNIQSDLENILISVPSKTTHL